MDWHWALKPTLLPPNVLNSVIFAIILKFLYKGAARKHTWEMCLIPSKRAVLQFSTGSSSLPTVELRGRNVICNKSCGKKFARCISWTGGRSGWEGWKPPLWAFEHVSQAHFYISQWERLQDLKGFQSSIEFSVSDSYVLFYLHVIP